MRNHAKCGLVGLLLVLLPVCSCAVLVLLATLPNIRRLDAFASNLFEYPLPPRTVEVRRSAKIELQGNGNHCDFIVEQEVLTELSHQEIENYYRDVSFPPAVEDPTLRGGQYSSVQPRIRFNAQPAVDNRLFAVISLTDVGNEPGFDPRCH